MSEPDGELSPADEENARVRNELSGQVRGNSLQIGTMRGDVIVGRTRRPLWSRPWLITIAVLLIAPVTGIGLALWNSAANDTAGRANTPTTESSPISVAVTVFASTCQTTWVVPRPPDQINLSAPISEQDWTKWEPTKDGVAASPGVVFATVQGRSEAQVVLTDLKVRVHDRQEALVGTNVRGRCGDSPAFRWLEVDLDAHPPRSTPVFQPEQALDAPDQERKPIKFPYEVSLADAETFVIHGRTASCLCAWTAELSWASEGRTGTIVIDDHGKPFRTTALRNNITCEPKELSGGAGKPVCG